MPLSSWSNSPILGVLDADDDDDDAHALCCC